ncbi:putative polyketide cyclase/dehydrase [Gordonia polyisoprenivorans VH2]|uniref:Putative polyketide cyclase/dehydrase n=1 Tax=Gordonia polyisoprenivorans (strain DSM 44266 / VH2) TaxID=1112204 RepID=H6MYN9_GORPV|nr:SRPBCC family protein [Gordonia polyisoprenivorans]AFA71917.1 putative polyketide cyclase/dehydrase [Gordonia polyisoprenivorans VH2]WCB38295.1 SRPBCC family protein [Gordonia polyisoprenivorans]
MSTLRSTILLEHNASEVWPVIRDVATINRWFPAITESSGDEHKRTVTLSDGATIIEEIVTLDDDLRRMQYRAVGGDLPIAGHLGTVDVVEIDRARSLLVYSTEIEPAELAEAFESAISGAVAALPAYLAG